MVPFYNTTVPFVNKLGKILIPWIQYLQQFTIAPPKVLDITVGASPFSYVAKEPGHVYINGGTVSAIHLIRGIVDLTVTGTILVPIGIEDTVIVTYSVLPTMKFVPSYGQNTNE